MAKTTTTKARAKATNLHLLLFLVSWFLVMCGFLPFFYYYYMIMICGDSSKDGWPEVDSSLALLCCCRRREIAKCDDTRPSHPKLKKADPARD